MNLTDRIIESIKELPPFPIVIQRAIQLIDDPNSSAQQVVEVVQFDQSITFDVLKVCNSAYFGLRRKVRSLKEAVVMVGFDQLLDIILSHESRLFFQESFKGYDLNQGDLWKHSVASGILSRILSKHLGHTNPNSLFTATLLHDIGKIVLNRYLIDYYDKIKFLIHKESLSFVEAEKKILGIDHAELGGRIVERWEFPEDIVMAIRYHHSPLESPNYSFTVDLVYLSDLISMLTGVGGGADGLSYYGYKTIMKRYGVKEKDIEHFILQLKDRVELVEGALLKKRILGVKPCHATS
jgi:putative nucleotidyltransferase with HDIG domain